MDPEDLGRFVPPAPLSMALITVSFIIDYFENSESSIGFFPFTGADVIGLNCCFDPEQLVEAVKTMKAALESSGYKKHLICQPLGCWTPDAGKDGYVGLPEFPFGLYLARFDS